MLQELAVQIKEAEQRLETIGFINLSDAALLLFRNKRFPTDKGHLNKVVRRVKKHKLNVVFQPSTEFINHYKLSHSDKPEVSYRFTSKDIELLKGLL